MHTEAEGDVDEVLDALSRSDLNYKSQCNDEIFSSLKRETHESYESFMVRCKQAANTLLSFRKEQGEAVKVRRIKEQFFRGARVSRATRNKLLYVNDLDLIVKSILRSVAPRR